MKRAVIGGFISLIGTIWSLAMIILAGNNLVSGWSTPPGRFITTVIDMDIVTPFIFSMILVFGGLIIMVVEFFKKDK